jgi:hypothetical protein
MEFPARKEYTDYYDNYVKLLKPADPIDLLQTTHLYLLKVVQPIDEIRFDYRYQTNKWTIKQLLLHLLDCEQILSYRALRFARHDFVDALPFSENSYADVADLTKFSKAYLIKSLQLMRAHTLHLFQGFTEEESRLGGSPIFDNSVRAIAAIISGHELHHLRVLQERYLNTTPKTIRF